MANKTGKITLHTSGAPGNTFPRGMYLIVAADGRDRLIQTDWEFPSVAQTFGFSLTSVQKKGKKCDHDGTDGTVTCKECGLTASDFISAASDFLSDHDGAEADDPGYF